MISSLDLQNAYVKFYAEMRRYIWDLEIVEMLAQVETEIYNAFIDFSKLRMYFYKLEKEIAEVCKEDEKLEKTFNKLKSLVDSDSDSYLRIISPKEVKTV